MIIIYHSGDPDGKCSGAYLKYKFPQAKLLPYNYGENFPWGEVKGQEVFLVDLSLSINELIHLSNISNLIWIDHHKSIINIAKKNKFNPPGLRKIGKAACELVWEFIESKPVLFPIYLIGRKDVSDNNAHSDVIPFDYGLKTIDYNPLNTEGMKNWIKIFSNDSFFINEIIYKGKIICDYKIKESIILSEILSFETLLNGKRAIAMNQQPASFDLFSPVWNSQKYDIMIVFAMLPNKSWKISLYTDKENVDVSEIAKLYNGGGHKHAAGFICKELPFE